MKKKIVGENQEEEIFLVSGGSPDYDDCPICQAMKKAEEEGRQLSEEELKQAFEEANLQQLSNQTEKEVN